MRRTGRGGARRALALAAVALAACLCAGAAFAAGGERGASDFASGVSDVPALAAEQDAGQQGGQDASGSAGDGSDQAGSGLELSKTAVYNEKTDDYTITLEAYATGSSTTTVVKDGADIVLMLDLSNYMYGTKYEPVADTTTLAELYAGQQSGTVYYVENDGAYQKVNVQRRSRGGGPGGGPGGSSSTYVYSVTNDVTNASLVTGRGPSMTLRSVSLSLFTASTDAENSSKLAALKTAVNGFIDKVHTEAPASRIAVVTYADGADVESGSRQADDEALVTVDDVGAEALKTIVDGLAIRGGASNSHYAAADAVKIFQDVPADSSEYERSRFALLFSAGVPGTGWDTNDSKTGGKDIAQATMHLSTILKTAKGSSAVLSTGSNFDGGGLWSESEIAGLLGGAGSGSGWKKGCGAKFYCVGLDIPSSGDPSEVNMTDDSHKPGALSNEYFWRISSHRPDGSHITSASDLGAGGPALLAESSRIHTYGSLYYFYPDSLTRNQEPDGYYMTTTSGDSGDLAKLDGIFDKIADSVVTGVTTSTTLGASAVVKDVVAPQFTVPENASDVNLRTADCAGASSSGALTFGEPTAATGVTATISVSTLSVTGFDFSGNWCGPRTDESGNTTYAGKKLIIEFKVKARGGFLGGNDVCTNDSAGVYESSAATEPVQTFERPAVNVPIKNVIATAQDKNVYLLGGLTAEQIKSGATAECGSVMLDLSKADQNYGLEAWQTKYVDIEVAYADASGNTVANLTDLEDDTTYTVTVKVSPKTDGSATAEGTVAEAKSGSATGEINVFKPELTFKDSEVWYGGDAPADYVGNKTAESWKHGDTPSTAAAMTGDKPTLSPTYAPEDGKISDDGKVASKDDVAVDVTVKIGETDVTDETAFKHDKCSDNASCADPSAGEFWLHVSTCSLTVEKAAASGTAIGDDEYFAFDVKKDGEAYTQAVVRGAGSVTISGLPVGTYSVSEDPSTAWRYTSAMENGSVTLGENNPSATVVCTNELKDGKWLNHFARAINVFGGENPVIESNIASNQQGN